MTLKQAEKSKYSGVLIALGHGLVEFPLMFLIYFVLSMFEIPSAVQVAVGLIGGGMLVFMGAQTIKSRNKREENACQPQEGYNHCRRIHYGINAGFILWWLTVADNVGFECTNLWFGWFHHFYGCALVH